MIPRLGFEEGLGLEATGLQGGRTLPCQGFKLPSLVTSSTELKLHTHKHYKSWGVRKESVSAFPTCAIPHPFQPPVNPVYVSKEKLTVSRFLLRKSDPCQVLGEV